MMRTIGWVVVSVAILGCLGLYFGWFSISTSKTGDEKANLQLSVNKDKVKDDVNAGKQGAKNLFGDKSASHEGQVVTAGDGKLAMSNKDGSNNHMHDVAADATITLEGKVVKLEELKEGNFVKVTTNTDDKGKTLATKIEAKAKS